MPDNFGIRFLCWLLTFSFVTFLWIFFRSTSMEGSISLITHIWNDFDIAYTVPFILARKTWFIFIVLIFILHAIRPRQYDGLKNLFINIPWWGKTLIFLVVIQLVLQFRTGSVQPFIYYQY